jgi:hypothetical protein
VRKGYSEEEERRRILKGGRWWCGFWIGSFSLRFRPSEALVWEFEENDVASDVR